MGITLSVNLSGGHLNPAVTLALAVCKPQKGRIVLFDTLKVLVYWSGQFLGAFLAAAIVFGIYSDDIRHLDSTFSIPSDKNTSFTTAGIFSTYPRGDHISNGACV